MTLTSHPAADLFPMLDGPELDALAADIRQHGQRDPIVLFDGKILDGRNRYKACEIARVEPRTVEWRGSDPIAFVVSTNLHRRHLNESQRGMVAARVKVMFEEGAKERQREGGRAKVVANLPQAKSRDQAAALLNVSPRTVQAADKVASCGSPELVRAVEQGKVAVSTAAVLSSAPKAEQTAIVACGEKEILRAAKEIRGRKTEERRVERTANLAQIAKGNAPLAVPSRCPVLLCDPPWRYEHAESESRAIENQYPTMSLDEIKALDVGKVTTDDAILFMWATSPKLAEAMEVVTAWGFTYRTCMVWVKDKIGMGYYARQAHELVLIATKGTPPTPPPAARPSSVLTAPRTEHSAKPVEFYGLIEAMYPTLPRMEMFARQPREGWQAWGNQS